MKKSLIFFLFLISITVFNKTNAVSKEYSNYRNYKNLSTLNFAELISKKTLYNIEKICTDEVCTYNLENDNYFLIKRHTLNILKRVKDDDASNSILLKGIKINKIYFKD